MGERLLSSFEGFDAEVQPVETILRGSVEDQAALHGILEQIESLGLELVEVRQVDERRERLVPGGSELVGGGLPAEPEGRGYIEDPARQRGRTDPDEQQDGLVPEVAGRPEAEQDLRDPDEHP